MYMQVFQSRSRPGEKADFGRTEQRGQRISVWTFGRGGILAETSRGPLAETAAQGQPERRAADPQIRVKLDSSLVLVSQHKPPFKNPMWNTYIVSFTLFKFCTML